MPELSMNAAQQGTRQLGSAVRPEMRLLLISVVTLTGCAATLPLETSEAHATVTLQNPDMMPYFDMVDGRILRNVPATIALNPGEHTLRYSCAAHFDGPP